MMILKTSNTNKDILIDDFNYERLKHLRITDVGKALHIGCRNKFLNKTISIALTKIILLTDSDLIDHKDRNYLNCQIYNLRPATQSQNCCNRIKIKTSYGIKCSSKYKGVSYQRDRHKWEASVSIKGKKIHLGRFGTEIEAAMAYNNAAIRYYGEFAVLNII